MTNCLSCDFGSHLDNPADRRNLALLLKSVPTEVKWCHRDHHIARRAHDHNWELDPITRSLLDTDFYKLLMLQFIWKQFPITSASFSFINRSVEVHLGDLIDADELREQLDQTKKLRFHKSELIWLAGNTFYGRRGIFEPAFLEWLERDFRLSDYELSVQDGQFTLSFRGLWTETTMWEIYALSAISELRTRASLKRLSEFELDILYARAKTKLWEKMERFARRPGPESERLWNEAAAQLLVAGIRRKSHERRARQQLYRNFQYLSGLSTRLGSDRNKCT